jgi:hypothetical protein
MSDPRPPSEPVSGPVETTGFRTWSSRSVGGDDGPEWQAWSWAAGRRGFSWLGVLLVLLGVGLLIKQFVPEVSFTSLLLVAIAVAFAAAWLIGGWNGATIPALALGAWATARLAVELGYLTGDGWTPLLVGAALLLAWALGSVQHVRREWALWVGLALGIFGLAQVSDALPGGWDLVWPLLLVGLGVVLIARRRRA